MTDQDAVTTTDHQPGVVVVKMKMKVLGVEMMKVDHLGGGMRKKTTGGKPPEVVVVTTSVVVAVIATGTDLAVTVTDLHLEDSRMREAGQTTVLGAVAVTTGVEEEENPGVTIAVPEVVAVLQTVAMVNAVVGLTEKAAVAAEAGVTVHLVVLTGPHPGEMGPGTTVVAMTGAEAVAAPAKELGGVQEMPLQDVTVQGTRPPGVTTASPSLPGVTTTVTGKQSASVKKSNFGSFISVSLFLCHHLTLTAIGYNF